MIPGCGFWYGAPGGMCIHCCVLRVQIDGVHVCEKAILEWGAIDSETYSPMQLIDLQWNGVVWDERARGVS